MDFLNDLNPVQRQAAAAVNGPIMIVAGAGSGKTRVLTYRIANLMMQGTDAFQILSLTFTNKAAKEMRERISHLVGADARNLWMGTFHSVFAKILRIECEKLGYPSNFSIYDTDDTKSLLKSIIKENELDDKIYKPGLIYNKISGAKNNLISPQEYAQNIDFTTDDALSGRPKIAQIYDQYVKRCFKAGAMDFDDLLFQMHKLLTKFPDILYKYQHKFKFILVDEYQDTNLVQYEIIKLLSAHHRNICVVGDDAQSIYSFRGANIQNILNFEMDYPELQVFKLEQNYRSSKNIVNAATNVIAQNKHQIRKELWTDNDQGDLIHVIRTISDNDEGQVVANAIFEEKLRNQLYNSDFAILYRTNAQSRSFEEALRKLNIAYTIYGGTSFYQRKEIKDLVAYMRLTVNKYDEEALKRVINYPARGIGDKTIEKLVIAANENNATLWDIAASAHQYGLGAVANKIDGFVTMIKSFEITSKKENAFDTAVFIAKHSGIRHELYSDKSVEGLSRYENLEAIMNGLKEFSESDEQEDKSLGNFLQSIALLTNDDTRNSDDNNKVSLMTVHAAKGLEFKQVFLVGMEENLFPSMLSLNSRSDLEEERRLFYVAVTRAREKLHITFALTRFKYGVAMNGQPSRFLNELGDGYIKHEGRTTQKPSSGAQSSLFPTRKVSYSGNTSTTLPLATVRPAPPSDPNFEADEFSYLIQNITVGLQLEHSRFGVGKVLSMEGKNENLKVVVFFPKHGQKPIMVKYAKLRLVKQ